MLNLQNLHAQYSNSGSESGVPVKPAYDVEEIDPSLPQSSEFQDRTDSSSGE